jgi:hypothetical protein
MEVLTPSQYKKLADFVKKEEADKLLEVSKVIQQERDAVTDEKIRRTNCCGQWTIVDRACSVCAA